MTDDASTDLRDLREHLDDADAPGGAVADPVAGTAYRMAGDAAQRAFWGEGEERQSLLRQLARRIAR